MAPSADLGAPVLTGIRRLSALDTVRARIALAVDLGLLAPGERLPPNAEIAHALGVGDITVRRALESLCENGILERRRGRGGGTLVAGRPPVGKVREIAAYREAADEVRELIDHRLVLECGLTHLAARGHATEQLPRLRALVERMAAAADWAEFHELDTEFHLTVAVAGGPPAAVKQYESVLRELHRYYLPYPMAQLRESNVQHGHLVDALAEGDAPRATDLAREHVQVLHHTMFVGLPGA